MISGDTPVSCAASLAARSLNRMIWCSTMSSPMRTTNRRPASSTRKLTLVMPRSSRSGLTGPDQMGSRATRSATALSSDGENIDWLCSGGLDAGEAGEGHGEVGLIVVEVFQLAAEIIHVGLHVEMAVAAEIEEDGAAATFLAAA